jgi:hypothetical protein
LGSVAISGDCHELHQHLIKSIGDLVEPLDHFAPGLDPDPQDHRNHGRLLPDLRRHGWASFIAATAHSTSAPTKTRSTALKTGPQGPLIGIALTTWRITCRRFAGPGRPVSSADHTASATVWPIV